MTMVRRIIGALNGVPQNTAAGVCHCFFFTFTAATATPMSLLPTIDCQCMLMKMNNSWEAKQGHWIHIVGNRR